MKWLAMLIGTMRLDLRIILIRLDRPITRVGLHVYGQ